VAYHRDSLIFSFFGAVSLSNIVLLCKFYQKKKIYEVLLLTSLSLIISLFISIFSILVVVTQKKERKKNMPFSLLSFLGFLIL